MKRIQIGLEFNGRGYIARPYWPEISRLIEIQKKSGFNRLKNEGKRGQALKSYLSGIGLNDEDYHELEQRAARRFYTDPSGEIIIPEEIFLAFMRSVAHEAPSAVRCLPPSQVNTTVRLEPLRTGKKKADGEFSRFVKNEESNERRRETDEYIVNFTARGVLEVDETAVKPAALQKMLEWGGQNKGIGSARPLGYGRFRVSQFEVLG